jgi:dTDP-4-amino-4,6-dideoxygalactose transaminase
MKVKFTDFKSEFLSLEKDLTNSFKNIGKEGSYILGKELEIFENKVKKILGANYVLGVGNWTEGMVMLCRALNFTNNDEIITVSNSFIATCGAISYAGCKPVLVDVDETLNMDANLLEKKITKNTKAIMPVHLSGIPAEIDQIKKICKKYNLIFIEDAAHAFGGKYKNKYLGTFGDVGIFSLHPRKNLHVFGDGGIIVTKNKKLYKKLLLLRNHGLRDRNESIIWGTNSRLDNMQASFGNVMLNKINKWNKKFFKTANYYSKNLKHLVQIPIYDNQISSPTFHQYIIRTNKRDSLKKFLNKKGIETAIHYPKPIHKQKAYINDFGNIKLRYTEKYAKQILSLPIHAFLNDQQIRYVVNNIKLFFNKN